ncbi:MAG: HAMP domain-containing histidine kinase [Planctomycetes bacterium]|nr:HAMP domain-containing histidine kinase [Planctomycetota bacterium]
MSSTALRYSIGLALAYGGLATAYIVVSSHIAAGASASVEELERIETLKGVLFVVVTTIGVWGGGLLAMRRMDRDAVELLRRERALVTNQGRALAGVTAASIAHDVNNVLMVVLHGLAQLREHLPRALQAQFDEVDQQLDRLVALNRRLLSAHRTSAGGERAAVDLWACVGECVASLRALPRLSGCRVQVRSGGDVEVETQALLVHQIVANLLLNAAEATGGRGRIDVNVREERGDALIEVADDGPGIPVDRREELFDALASTKDGGTGLGLFSVRACAQSLGGAVEIADSPLGGACLRVRLPGARSTSLAR